MAPKAGRKTTASAGGERTGPVTLGEALERLLLLSCFEGKPHKVASWLDDRFRDDDIPLLGNGVAMVPSPMLRIAALVPPAGPAVLHVVVSGGPIDWIDNSPYWPLPRKDRPEQPDLGQEHLQRHHRYWTLDRAGFEKHFPGEPESCNGHPQQPTTSEPLDLKDDLPDIVAGRIAAAEASWNADGVSSAAFSGDAVLPDNVVGRIAGKLRLDYPDKIGMPSNRQLAKDHKVSPRTIYTAVNLAWPRVRRIRQKPAKLGK
jgi:hypothetical protein